MSAQFSQEIKLDSKMKILSLIILPHDVPNLEAVISSMKYKNIILVLSIQRFHNKFTTSMSIRL